MKAFFACVLCFASVVYFCSCRYTWDIERNHFCQANFVGEFRVTNVTKKPREVSKKWINNVTYIMLLGPGIPTVYTAEVSRIFRDTSLYAKIQPDTLTFSADFYPCELKLELDQVVTIAGDLPLNRIRFEGTRIGTAIKNVHGCNVWNRQTNNTQKIITNGDFPIC